MADWKKQALEYAGAIVAAVKARTGDFLDKHQDAADLLKERSLRMAELGIEFALAKDDAAREAAKSEMEAVTLTLETAAVNIALDADEESRSFFKDMLKIALEFAKEAIPFLVKLAPLA